MASASISPKARGKRKFLRLKNSAELPAGLRGAVLAIGNFDGVHKGHQAVLQTALARARHSEKPALVFTFEPHPRALFKPDEPVYRLSNAGQKAVIFAAMGFDGVIEQEFSPAFAALSAAEFIREIIVKRCAAACLVAGANFHFGHKRQGTPDYLRQAGQDYGFAVELVSGQNDEKGLLISSSRIRAALARGDIAEANALLGRPYTVEAPIIHGEKLGRTLGFPTANMALPAETKLKFGIYAVYITVDTIRYKGVASFGRRPTVAANGKPLLETYIFDFSGDIYGKQAQVEFIRFLRGEEKFADMESLTAQMHKDALAARKAL